MRRSAFYDTGPPVFDSNGAAIAVPAGRNSTHFRRNPLDSAAPEVGATMAAVAQFGFVAMDGGFAG